VEAEQPVRRHVHPRVVELRRHPGDAVTLERVAEGVAVGDAVLVPAPHGREARVEARERLARLTHDDVRHRTEHAVHPTGERLVRRQRRALAVGPPQQRDLRSGEVDVGDLTERVDARVGAARDGERGRVARPAEDGREGVLEHALHRAESRLSPPAVEVGALIGDVEPVARHQVGHPSILWSDRRVGRAAPGEPTVSRDCYRGRFRARCGPASPAPARRLPL